MKIMILCDSPKTFSGFSVVGKNLAIQLKQLGHEVVISGFQTSNEPESYYGIKILPVHIQHIDELGQYIVNVQKYQPDICICIFNADDTSQNEFVKAIKPSFWYVPIEGREISDTMARDLYDVSTNGKIIAQCNWGKNEMMKVGIDSTTIYHGYNSEVFKKEDIRKIISGEKINVIKCETLIQDSLKTCTWKISDTLIDTLRNIFDNKFVFGFVGANHGIRKRIERLLTSYSLFLKDNKQRKDRTVLVLRTMPISITSPANLIKICSKLGISSNVIFLHGENNRLSDEAMNAIYNCFDVNVSASSSEGFGLSCIESMAYGVPQIGPSCSSFIELIKDIEPEKDRGLLAEKGEWVMINDGSYRFEVNEQDLADKMSIMYLDKDLRERCGKNASKWIKSYTWKKVADQWNDLISSYKK